MLNSKLYLYIQNNEYIKYYNKKGICKKIFTSNVESIKNKRLVIIFETKDVLIKEIVFPNVSKSFEYNMVYNELIYEIGKSEDIIFDYSIHKYSDKMTEAFVYCLRYDNDKIFKSLLKNNSIAGIYNFPMLFLNCIKVSVSEYIAVCKNSNKMYIMACYNNCLVGFSCFGYCSKEDLNKNLAFFISELLDEKYKKCRDAVYLINFDTNEFIKEKTEECKYYNIGRITVDQIIRKMC